MYPVRRKLVSFVSLLSRTEPWFKKSWHLTLPTENIDSLPMIDVFSFNWSSKYWSNTLIVTYRSINASGSSVSHNSGPNTSRSLYIQIRLSPYRVQKHLIFSDPVPKGKKNVLNYMIFYTKSQRFLNYFMYQISGGEGGFLLTIFSSFLIYF